MDSAVDQTKKAVVEVTNLAQSLQEGAGPQIDAALNEAESWLDKIKELFPTTNHKDEDSKMALNKSNELRSKMTQNLSPINTVNESLKSMKNKSETLQDKILDIEKITNRVRDKAVETNLLNDANR